MDETITRSELLAMVKKAHQSLEPWGTFVEEIEKRTEPGKYVEELPTHDEWVWLASGSQGAWRGVSWWRWSVAVGRMPIKMRLTQLGERS